MNAPDWARRAYPGARTSPIYPTGPSGPSQSQIDQFAKWNSNVAGKDQLAAGSVPVAGSSVNGTVKTSSVSVAPASSVGVKDTNLLASQNFTASTTVVAQGAWSWWGEDGHVFKGCARVDCNGSQSDLVSNEIAVVPGERVTVSVYVKWSGLTYTGSNVIALGVEKYREGRDPETNGTIFMDVGGQSVASVASPAASSGWVKLSGDYTVPDSGVDQLRFKFHAARGITQGYILWDEAEFRKIDLIPDEAVPGVGEINDNVVNNLYGQEGTGFGHADAAKAFSNTSSAVTSVSSKVASLEAAGSGGSIAGDDFTYTATVLSSGYWSGSYSTGVGYYSADSQAARWHTNSIGVCDARFYWTSTGATSTGDYQLVQLVLASALYQHPIATGAYSSISIYGRISSDWQSYVKLTINGDTTWTLKNAVAGVETTMTSGTVTLPGVGSTISLYLGSWATSTPRMFTADINGSPLLSYTEGGTTSQVGASNRRWGWGGVSRGWRAGYYGRLYLYQQGQVGSPDVDQWLATDQ